MVHSRLARLLKGFSTKCLSPRVLLLAFLTLAVIGLGYAVLRPTIVADLIQRDNHTKIAQRNALQREALRLEKYKKWLQTPEGIIDQARHRGMLAPNEEIVRFPPQKDAVSAQPPTAAPEEDSSLSTLLFAGLLVFLLAFLIGISLLLYRWQRRRTRKAIGVLTTRAELTRRNKPSTVSR